MPTIVATIVLGMWTAVAAGQAPAAAAGADALWDAARKGDAAAVTRLLDAGVDVNAPFRYGATALSYACDRGHLEVVKVLLARGANPNVKDSFYGATPLSWASSPAQTRKPEHAEIVRLLLKHGAKGAEGALASAVAQDDGPMVRAILEHGGLPASVLSDTLEAAQDGKKTDIVAALTQHGAKPHPVVSLSEAQLGRLAGTYTNGATELTFAVQDGGLAGRTATQTLALVPQDELTFRLRGRPGMSVVFTLDGDRAATAAVRTGDGNSTVYKRVEGK